MGRSEVLRDAALTAESGTDDAIDHAITAVLEEGALDGWQATDLHPFDATRKYADTQATGPGGVRRRVAKGAVQAMLDLPGVHGDADAGVDTGLAARLAEVTRGFAAKGYRALAVARTGDPGRDVDRSGERAGDRGRGLADTRWRITGVIALQEPPRDDSATTLQQASRLGVEVKMVTGDRGEIAAEIGLGDRILPASRMGDADSERLATEVEHADGFAEVGPYPRGTSTASWPLFRAATTSSP